MREEEGPSRKGKIEKEEEGGGWRFVREYEYERERRGINF